MRAVIYARVSSQAQKDRHTIASQLSQLPEFVASRGWKLVRPADTYVDDGRTAKAGHLAERPGFTKLLEDARRRAFDVVAVVDLDRLTRSEDLRERGEVLGAFQNTSVQIAVSSNGQLLDLRSSMGDLMSSLGAFFAAEENRKRRERSVRGKHEAIRKGKKPSGPTPFGYLYDKADGAWKIDPDLGPVVKEIFERVSAAETCHAIAMDLQTRGVPRARASMTGRRQPGTWSRERVWQIARARTYLGTWIADKARKLTVAVPPIVTEDLFDDADDALMRAGRRGQARVRHVYLAQGLSKCALCGAPIGCASVNSGASDRRRLFYYVCTRRRRPQGERCTLPMRRVDEVDGQLWASFAEILMRPDLVERALRAQGDETETGARDSATDLEHYTKKLARLEEAEAMILERFSRGMIAPTVMDRHLAKTDRERQMLKRQIAFAKNQAAAAVARRHQVAALETTARTLRTRLETASPTERRELVRALCPGLNDNWILIGPTDVTARILLAPEPRSLAAHAKVDGSG